MARLESPYLKGLIVARHRLVAELRAKNLAKIEQVAAASLRDPRSRSRQADG